MAYTALYRKYRSRTFGEVIGQEHVTTVLQNAIRAGRIAHAYLFCGPRGCGKTTTARLLARALNCQASAGPTPDPCGECPLCRAIRAGNALDVVEMDAASETGIDDVREKIIENAKFAPAEARFKVYIIDEVHDLSQKAFDSLLKTIEEPPAHVVFVLATTEAHKVPITIRSRCQRMDFRRGKLEDLTANLRRVLEAEGIAYEAGALLAVARAAEGSYRDSLSILEQVLAYSEGGLTAEAVHAAVGTVGPELLDEVVSALAADDLAGAFHLAGRLVDSGKDVRQVLIAVQGRLRDLMVARIARSAAALQDATPERLELLRQQAARFQTGQLLRMLEVLAEAERDVRFTSQHRLLLERAFWSILPSSLSVAAPSATAEAAPMQRQEPRQPAPRQAPPPPVEPAASTRQTAPLPAEGGPPPAAIDLEGLRRLWPRVMRRITQTYRAAATVFDSVRIAALEGRSVVLEFPNEFARERADRPRAREVLEQAIAQEIGAAGLKVRCDLARGGPDPATAGADATLALTVAEDPPPEGDSSPEPASTGDDEEDILKVVLKEFGGKLRDA